MTTRAASIVLITGLALLHSLLVFNNVTDFGSNYQFVRHVLSMDSTFPGNHAMWRSVHSPALHLTFYIGIIAWEFASAVLLWWGALRLLRAVRLPARSFNASKRIAIAALTLSMSIWLFAFLTIGAEWFLMWQSREWNGQEAAFRMFVVVGLTLLIIIQPETELGP